MPGPILVPLDGTPQSTRALPHALALARATGAPLELVRVLETPPSGTTGRAVSLGVTAAIMEAHDRGADELHALADTLRPAGVDVTATPLAGGLDVPAALLAHAEARGASMVVMATAARGALGRAFVGSVADAVMRRAGRPVVLVPPGADVADPPAADLSAANLPAADVPDAGSRWRVLVPLDGSVQALGAVEYLLGAGDALPVDVLLFHALVPRTLAGVVAPEPLLDPDALGEAQARARAQLEAVAQRFAARGVPVRTEVAPTSDPAAAVADAARAAGAHLVVMTTRGEGGLKRLVVGSTAAAVVRATPAPVLLLAPE